MFLNSHCYNGVNILKSGLPRWSYNKLVSFNYLQCTCVDNKASDFLKYFLIMKLFLPQALKLVSYKKYIPGTVVKTVCGSVTYPKKFELYFKFYVIRKN